MHTGGVIVLWCPLNIVDGVGFVGRDWAVFVEYCTGLYS